MRWPLRLQIMLPMAAIMLLTVFVVGGLGAYLSAQAAKARISGRIAGVVQILEQSNFPLTDAVLQQMKALSGADLVLVDAAGQMRATSGGAPLGELQLPAAPQEGNATSVLDNRIWVRDKEYFHSIVDLGNRPGTQRDATLHVFYPERELRRAWQRAVIPSLGFIVVAMPVVMWLAAATSSRISRRVRQLQSQVEHIAEGKFEQIAVPERDDEIRALCQSVNRMAAMLAGYESEVRQTERMRTLAILGGGVAHQLRNSVTGCSIALDLHAEECSTGQSCESLGVARRQLQLMEEYIQRFLQLGKRVDERRRENVELAALVESVLPLVQPMARHSGVLLQWKPDQGTTHTVAGDATCLGQLIINLVLNAVEAAAQNSALTNTPGHVTIKLEEQLPTRIVLTVSDNGRGPDGEVHESLFEPFVTGKRDGVGLGLSVARDVVLEHGGRIDWRRVGGNTEFIVELPAVASELLLPAPCSPLPASAAARLATPTAASYS
jgi:signal transduction histidine kinase